MARTSPITKVEKKPGFKANPVNRKVLSASSVVCGIPKIKQTKPKTTTVREFKFATDARLRERKARNTTVTIESKMVKKAIPKKSTAKTTKASTINKKQVKAKSD